MAVTDRQIRSAVDRALTIKPRVFDLGGNRYAVGSHSNPGHGYLLKVVEGKVVCECEGYVRTGICYHAAALSIDLAILPIRSLQPETSPAPVRGHDAPLVGSRSPLWD